MTDNKPRPPLKPLAVGDSVVFYTASGWNNPAVRNVGSIIEIYHTMKTAKVSSSSGTNNVPLRNLKRLKPRPPKQEPKPERVEISGETNGGDFYIRTASYGARRMLELAMPIQNGPGRNFFVTELFPSERIVDREMLASLIVDTLNEDPGLLVGTIEKWKKLLRELREPGK